MIAFILPQNDIESIAIAELLSQNNIEYFITDQGLNRTHTWESVDLNILQKSRALALAGFKIYGIELLGVAPNGFINIDHHNYPFFGCNRSARLSSIEQVAELIDVQLNERQRAISAYDIGGNFTMKQRGCSKFFKSIETQDRRIKGVTVEDDKAAKDAIEEALVIRCEEIYNHCDSQEWCYGDLHIIFDAPHKKFSAYIAQFNLSNAHLAICYKNGEDFSINVFGDKRVISFFHRKFEKQGIYNVNCQNPFWRISGDNYSTKIEGSDLLCFFRMCYIFALKKN